MKNKKVYDSFHPSADMPLPKFQDQMMQGFPPQATPRRAHEGSNYTAPDKETLENMSDLNYRKSTPGEAAYEYAHSQDEEQRGTTQDFDYEDVGVRDYGKKYPKLS